MDVFITAMVPFLVALIYFLNAVAKRPNPELLTGWKRKVWLVADAFSFLTADTFPGKLKMPGTLSPPPEQKNNEVAE